MTKDLLIETWFFVTGHNLGVKRLMNDWLVSRRRYISIKGPDSGDAVEVAEVMKEDTPEINRCHGLLITTTPLHRATTWFSFTKDMKRLSNALSSSSDSYHPLLTRFQSHYQSFFHSMD